MSPSAQEWFAPYAWLPTGIARDVRFTIVDDRFSRIETGVAAGSAPRLTGVVLPGLANAHSHAFHRALRGRTQSSSRDVDTFWGWREGMYAVADRLDPDTYLALARATYAEMVLAGITAVGEFHYLHHGPGGVPYDDPNEMAGALRQAADDAGLRLTLLDTCYLAGGLDAQGHAPLTGTQRRFGDRDVDAWAQRVGALTVTPTMRLGAAVHSVRAVPREALASVVAGAAGRPLHVHLSEQPAENAACVNFYGCSPTALLNDSEVLGPRTTAVHATHLSRTDLSALAETATTVCMCPTTERDLGDGVGPARRLADAGCALSLGSDQHAVIDPFEEMRGLELDERLESGQRGRFAPAELLAAATAHASIGWPEAGRLEVGAVADLVAVRMDTVRTAGVDPAQIMFAATAADVDTVVVSGRPVVTAGCHQLGDVASMLASAIEPLWQ